MTRAISSSLPTQGHVVTSGTMHMLRDMHGEMMSSFDPMLEAMPREELCTGAELSVPWLSAQADLSLASQCLAANPGSISQQVYTSFKS